MNVNSVAHTKPSNGFGVWIGIAWQFGYAIPNHIPDNIMSKTNDAIAEIKGKIHTNPVLAYTLGLGFLKAKPKAKDVELILDMIDPAADYDVEKIRQECHDVLNRVGQLTGSLLKGTVGSIRGFRSGTVMTSLRGSRFGGIFQSAMEALTVIAVDDIKAGKIPTYIQVPDGKGGLKFQWEAMCSILNRMSFEKFDRSYDAVHELFTAQLEANNCLEPVEKTPTETVNTLEFEGAAKEVATV